MCWERLGLSTNTLSCQEKETTLESACTRESCFWPSTSKTLITHNHSATAFSLITIMFRFTFWKTMDHWYLNVCRWKVNKCIYFSIVLGISALREYFHYLILYWYLWVNFQTQNNNTNHSTIQTLLQCPGVKFQSDPTGCKAIKMLITIFTTYDHKCMRLLKWSLPVQAAKLKWWICFLNAGLLLVFLLLLE